jgi:hypothetical protein
MIAGGIRFPSVYNKISEDEVRFVGSGLRGAS